MSDEEFYNLCQEYRHAPMKDQAYVVQCFEKIKSIHTQLAEARALLVEAKERYESYNTDVILSSFWQDWLDKLNEFLGEE